MENYGQKVSDVKIGNTKIALFSNGSCNFVSNESSFDNENNYLGMEYQCVEFVRRYIYLTHNKNLALKWSDGDAVDWYDNRGEMNLEEVHYSDANIGDIITFTGGLWGHVGVISKINHNKDIRICSQNFYNDIRDIDTIISMDILQGREEIKDATGTGFKFQSVLRIK